MLPTLTVPDDLHYLIARQVWARPHDDGTATVGITELGIQLSGEIFMARPKSLGIHVVQGGTVAVVELSKSIVAVKCAVSGTVVERNEALRERPSLVHRDPYGDGWLARLELDDFEADQPGLAHGAAAREAMQRHLEAHRDLLVPAMLKQQGKTP